MLLAVPRGRINDGIPCNDRHYHQLDLWRNMGHLGETAVAMGRAFCQFDGKANFRLVSNFGSLALQTQSHAHVHILGSAFQTSYPDLRCREKMVFENGGLQAFEGSIPSPPDTKPIKAVMVVPRRP